MKKSRLLIVGLILVLFGSFMAYNVQTVNGNVKIEDVVIAGKDGSKLSAMLYVPKNAKNESPAPGVLAVHGYTNSKEMQSSFAIEYARRGYVVLAIDMSGHGFSDLVQIKDDPSRGAISGLLYLRNLPFVDKNNIALEGHSMGGWSVLAAADKYPDYVKTVVLEGSAPGVEGGPTVTTQSKYNLAVSFGLYDETAKFMWNVEKARDILNTQKLKNAFGVKDAVKEKVLYGSFQNESARKIYLPKCTHGEQISKEAIGYSIEFIQDSIRPVNPIDPNNQISLNKDSAALIGLLGLILFMIGLGSLVLEIPYFAVLKLPKRSEVAVSGLKWWIIALIVTVVPALSYFTFESIGEKLIVRSMIWPQVETNKFMFWAVLNALIFIIILLIWHYAFGNKKGQNEFTYGVSTGTQDKKQNYGYIGRAILVSVITVALTYILLAITYEIFNIDFRMIVTFKIMDPKRFVAFLAYIIPFGVFFFAHSLVLNGLLRLKELKSEFKTNALWMFVNAFISMIGFVGILLIHNIYINSTETLFFKDFMPLFFLYQVAIFMPITGVISTYFYRKTNSIYVGAFTSALFATWYIVAIQPFFAI